MQNDQSPALPNSSLKRAVVVTTINSPSAAVEAIAALALEEAAEFYIIGDASSPEHFNVKGANYYDLAAQRKAGFAFGELCPTRHYARKNIGYLLAMSQGVQIILETDDDNIPRSKFLAERSRNVSAALVSEPGWCNVYKYFSSENIWPRGLPLKEVLVVPRQRSELNTTIRDCPIQQGLADKNPDVDAIYRLVLPLPLNFDSNPSIILDKDVWCPFNSQNTMWWREAFPLLYLPFYCSFRMTDIWRSFVAQRLAWECGWSISFFAATVYQERNEHDLSKDFADEIPGYLHNDRICKTLQDLPLGSGAGAITQNLRASYRALVKMGVIGSEELSLLDAWVRDVERIL